MEFSEGRGTATARAGQLTGYLVHIRDHQQQTLGRGKGGGQCAGLQRTMDGTSGGALTLHLDDARDRAPQVFAATG